MNNPHVDTLWKKSQFTKKILNFIFDEGHCISQWGAFRNEYLQVGALRYLIPESIPFYIASVTLPRVVLSDIIDIMHLRPNKTEYIMCSNNRPEINLVVKTLDFPANSFKDLAFLIPEGYSERDAPLPKFLIFFNSRVEAEKACLFLQSLLP
jgi:superfamily II DNA helicase RecQ